MSAKQWWETFFDDDYFRIWGQLLNEENSGKQAAAVWSMLDLTPGCRVLDAPCGWGRLSRALAQLGANVVGADQSEALLDVGNRNRGELSAKRLRYVKHDLRTPLSETGFDVACNIFTSFGYGTAEEDVAIFRTLRGRSSSGRTCGGRDESSRYDVCLYHSWHQGVDAPSRWNSFRGRE